MYFSINQNKSPWNIVWFSRDRDHSFESVIVYEKCCVFFVTIYWSNAFRERWQSCKWPIPCVRSLCCPNRHGTLLMPTYSRDSRAVEWVGRWDQYYRWNINVYIHLKNTSTNCTRLYQIQLNRNNHRHNPIWPQRQNVFYRIGNFKRAVTFGNYQRQFIGSINTPSTSTKWKSPRS